MTYHDHTTVVGVFHDSDRARDAIEALKDSGFAAQDIGILMKDRGEARDIADETGTQAGEGAVTGMIGGGILGGLAGWLVGIGALAIPGVGPFIAAGAFGTALAGAGIGAGIGAIAGALVGMGIPKDEAEYYEGEVRSGRTLVTVDAHDRFSDARNILRRFGAYDVHDRGTSDTMTTTDSMSTEHITDDQRRMQLREEELRATKERERVGEVGIHKEVVSEHRSMDVPVKYEEHATAQKETETVSGTVRREDLRVDKQGDFEIIGGENYGKAHEHRWVGDRCEICGATRRMRRAA